MKITNEAIAGPKPVFVLMAGIHAREIATPEIALRLAEWLTQNYGRDADATWLVDQHEIWVLPTTNPDGHWYVELGTQVDNGDEPWLWRKNGHAYSSGAWPPTAFDHHGVDLNRNFDFHWGTQGVEWDPRSQTYPGPSAASEPETQAVQNLLEQRVFRSARDRGRRPCVRHHQRCFRVLAPARRTRALAVVGHEIHDAERRGAGGDRPEVRVVQRLHRRPRRHHAVSVPAERPTTGRTARWEYPATRSRWAGIHAPLRDRG